MRLGPCAWTVISPFPPDHSTGVHEEDPFRDQRSEELRRWRVEARGGRPLPRPLLPICRLHDRIRPIEKVERPNLDAAIRIVITKVRVGCGGDISTEVAQSSWKCNKEQGIASRVDSGGELEASLYVRLPERSSLWWYCGGACIT